MQAKTPLTDDERADKRAAEQQLAADAVEQLRSIERELPKGLAPAGRVSSELPDIGRAAHVIEPFPRRLAIAGARQDEVIRATTSLAPSDVRERADVLIAKLATLGMPCDLERVVEGPQVTRYELRPTNGALMREILRTADDLAFALGAYPARVLAPLPDHAGLIAVELPCAERRIIRLDELPPPREPLSFPLGFDVDGEPAFCDLTLCPHLLICGETNSGKSSAVNAMLCSFLTRFGPDHLSLVLIDLKQVELRPYAWLPHLLAPVGADIDTALACLRSLVKMMELRYDVAAQMGARSLPELNVKLEAAGHKRYPFVLCVVDELADLMMSSKTASESLIVRLAQKARAVGIHLVLATQSPRVAVCSGLIRANIPSRVCFAVSSQTDSRVVLGRNGAELLLGCGDGLLSMGGARCVRFQGAYATSDEIEATCNRWRGQAA